MFEKLEARAARLAREAVVRVRRRIVQAARDIPGVEARESDEGVVLSGRLLRARAFVDARLRWIAGWLR